MAHQPQEKAVKSFSDPLAEYHGKPLVGVSSSHSRYLGRVVVELYESPLHDSASDGLVFSADLGLNVGIDYNELLRRVAAALPRRVQNLPE